MENNTDLILNEVELSDNIYLIPPESDEIDNFRIIELPRVEGDLKKDKNGYYFDATRNFITLYENKS